MIIDDHEQLPNRIAEQETENTELRRRPEQHECLGSGFKRNFSTAFCERIPRPVLPHPNIEYRAGWVTVNPIGGEFHETVAPAFLRVAEGSNRPSPHQRNRTVEYRRPNARSRRAACVARLRAGEMATAAPDPCDQAPLTRQGRNQKTVHYHDGPLDHKNPFDLAVLSAFALRY